MPSSRARQVSQAGVRHAVGLSVPAETRAVRAKRAEESCAPAVRGSEPKPSAGAEKAAAQTAAARTVAGKPTICDRVVSVGLKAVRAERAVADVIVKTARQRRTIAKAAERGVRGGCAGERRVHEGRGEIAKVTDGRKVAPVAKAGEKIW